MIKSQVLTNFLIYYYYLIYWEIIWGDMHFCLALVLSFHFFFIFFLFVCLFCFIFAFYFYLFSSFLFWFLVSYLYCFFYSCLLLLLLMSLLSLLCLFLFCFFLVLAFLLLFCFGLFLTFCLFNNIKKLKSIFQIRKWKCLQKMLPPQFETFQLKILTHEKIENISSEFISFRKIRRNRTYERICFTLFRCFEMFSLAALIIDKLLGHNCN